MPFSFPISRSRISATDPRNCPAMIPLNVRLIRHHECLRESIFLLRASNEILQILVSHCGWWPTLGAWLALLPLDPLRWIRLRRPKGALKRTTPMKSTNRSGWRNSCEPLARFSRGITSGTLVLSWLNCWTSAHEAKDKNRGSCRAVQIGPRTQEVTFHAQFSPRQPKFPCVKESNSPKVPCFTVAKSLIVPGHTC